MLEVEYQKDGTRLEAPKPVASDAEQAAYDSLASSETPSPARGLANGSVPFFAIAGVALELNDAIFKLDPVGNVTCKRVINDHIYGTCSCGGVEYSVFRNLCFKISARDPRLFAQGTTFYEVEGRMTCMKVQYQSQMILNENQVQLLHALTDQRVGTDSLNQGIKTVGAQVQGRVYRDVIGGVGSKYQDLRLVDLLLLDSGTSE